MFLGDREPRPLKRLFVVTHKGEGGFGSACSIVVATVADMAQMLLHSYLRINWRPNSHLQAFDGDDHRQYPCEQVTSDELARRFPSLGEVDMGKSRVLDQFFPL